MPEFTKRGRERIHAVVRTVEATGQDARTRPITSYTPQSLRWFMVSVAIDPDTHEGEGYIGEWSASADDGAGELSRSVFKSYTIRDTTGQCSAAEGEWVLCRPIGSLDGNVWEILSTTGTSVPDGTTTNDILRWDATNEEWVIFAAPSTSGTWFLTVVNGTMTWKEAGTGACS